MAKALRQPPSNRTAARLRHPRIPAVRTQVRAAVGHHTLPGVQLIGDEPSRRGRQRNGNLVISGRPAAPAVLVPRVSTGCIPARLTDLLALLDDGLARVTRL